MGATTDKIKGEANEAIGKAKTKRPPSTSRSVRDRAREP